MSSSTIEARVLQVVAALHSRSVLTTIVRAWVNADPPVSSHEIAGKLGRPVAEIYETRPEATGIPRRRYRARKPKTVTVQLAVAPAVVAPRIVDPIEALVVSHIKSGSPVDGARVLQKMRGLSKYESWLKVEQLRPPIGNGAASAH
jgi:hypothetical protein